MLIEAPGDDPIQKSQANNIQILYHKIICERLKIVVQESTALETYKMQMTLKPDSNNKKIEFLKIFTAIESSDIKAYVVGMQTIQKKLRDIDTNDDH